jgi:hypothetical protein
VERAKPVEAVGEEPPKPRTRRKPAVERAAAVSAAQDVAPPPPEPLPPAIVATAGRLAMIGATDEEIWTFLDISESTFYRWRNQHPEFTAAMQLGAEHANARVKRRLYDRAIGYDVTEQHAIKVRKGVGKEMVEEVVVIDVKKHVPADPRAIEFFLTNRDGQEWKLRRNHEHSGEVIHTITPDEARREIAEFMKAEAEKPAAATTH